VYGPVAQGGVDAGKLRGALTGILDGLPKVEGTGGDVQIQMTWVGC